MQFPEIKPIKRQTEKVNELMGMDVRPLIAEGWFNKITNFNNDKYPIITPDKKFNMERSISIIDDDVKDILIEPGKLLRFESDGKLKIRDVDKTTNITYSGYTGEVENCCAKAIRDKIVIFPHKVVFDTKTKRYTPIETSWEPSYTDSIIQGEYNFNSYVDQPKFKNTMLKGDSASLNLEINVSGQSSNVEGSNLAEYCYINKDRPVFKSQNITITKGTESVTYETGEIKINHAGYKIYASGGSGGTTTVYKFVVDLNFVLKEDMYGLDTGERYTISGSFDFSGYDSNDSVYTEITMLDSKGREVTNVVESTSAPEEPYSGQYWIDTSVYPSVMKQWDDNSDRWVQVISSSYKVKVFGETLPDSFNEYDTVTFHTENTVGTETYIQEEDLEGDWVIREIGENRSYFVINAVLPKVKYKFYEGFYITRDCPNLDMICVSDNRVWGVNSETNEIYASKLGDPFNWYGYEDLSTDSYALELAIKGNFTGLYSMNSAVYAFKNNCIHRIYGTKPQNYSLKVFEGIAGAVEESNDFICSSNGYIYYCGYDGVYAFDGTNYPSKISSALENTSFPGHSAIVNANKLYILGENSFIYDISRGTWHKSNNMQIDTNAIIVDNKIMFISIFDYDTTRVHALSFGPGEDICDAEFVTGDIAIGYDNRKYLTKINFRYGIKGSGKISIYVSYDDGSFSKIKDIEESDVLIAKEIPIIIRRCDHVKLKVTTEGNVTIYGYTKEIEVASIHG